MTKQNEPTSEDEAWFAEVCTELQGLINRIKDRAQGDETAICRAEKVVHAHRAAAVDEERRLLDALLVVMNVASLLCRGGDETIRTSPQRLVMRAEIGAESPLWDEDGAMVWLDSLPLPAELQNALTQWAEKGWEGNDNAVADEGRRLYGAVVKLLVGTEVVWDND